MPEIIRRYYEPGRPVELRPVEIGPYFAERIHDGGIHIWMKSERSCRMIRRCTYACWLMPRTYHCSMR